MIKSKNGMPMKYGIPLLSTMELAGIEPASESPSIAVSPITVYHFCVP